MLLKIIEETSFWGAVLGSGMLALNLSFSGWAYIPFLMSNIATFYVLRGTDVPKVIVRQTVFFTIINIIGIIRWL